MTVESARPSILTGLVTQHIECAAEALAEVGSDGLLLFRGTNILAFCGVPLSPSDRLICGLLNRDGQIALVLPAFEADMADALPSGGRLVTWKEEDDPYVAVARAAEMLGISTGRILLDAHTWLCTQHRLGQALPKAELVVDPGVIRQVRITKSPEEIEAIRAACEDTGRIYPLISECLRAGISELELRREVLGRLELEGLTAVGDLIQGGENTSVPHRSAGHRQFQNGDTVIVDFVCRHEGYLGDLTRTFALGEPAEDIRRAYSVVRAAQRAAIESVRPGVACEDVDAAARSVIESAGLGEFFCHRLGHGIGLDVHEPPYLVQGNSKPLMEGMCMTIEPGVYVPGRFGIRIEDVVAVTSNGCELLSSTVPTDVSNF